MIHRLILAYILTTSIVAEKPTTTYGLVGGTVTLKTNIKDTPDQILWKHKGNKVVEVDGQEQHVFGSFLNRITLNRSSVELKIADLSYEDSGDYVLETYNKRLYRSNYELEVIDKVAKPTISCKMNTSSSSSTSANQATLMCSSEPGRFQSLMKFEWSSHEKSEQHLTISLGDQHDDKVYTCTVSNPVSKESTTFTAKDCYNGDGPGEGNASSDRDSDSDSGIAIGIGIAFAFAILLLIALLFCKLKHKACFDKGNDEERASHGKKKGSRNGEENQSLLNQSDSDKKAGNGEEEKSALANPVSPPPGIGPKPKSQIQQNSVKQKPPVPSKKPTNPFRNDKGNTDVTQVGESTENKVSECDPADPENANVVLSGALNNDNSGKKTGNGEEEKSALANPVSPTVQPCSPSTTEPLNMLPKDDADERKEDANSHQVTGETQEKTSENMTEIGPKPKSQIQQNSVKQKPPVPGKKPTNPPRNVKEDTVVAQVGESTENKVSECDPADPEKADVVAWCIEQ